MSSPLHKQVEDDFEDFAMSSIRRPGFLADDDDDDDDEEIEDLQAGPVDEFGPMTEASPDSAITPPGFELGSGAGSSSIRAASTGAGEMTLRTTTISSSNRAAAAQHQPSPDIGFFGRLQKGKIPIPVIISRDPNLELAMDKLVVEPFRQFSEMVKDPKARVVEPLRQFSENTSAQFKHQIERIERLGSHRPANLYDPPTNDNEERHVDLHMDRIDWKIRFMAFQQRLHIFLEDPSSSFASLVFNLILILLIILATISMCIETVDDMYRENENLWFMMDAVVTGIFTVELLARIIARATSLHSLFQLFTSFLFLIDVFAILPFYLEIISPRLDDNYGRLTGLRMVRIFRLLKMFRFMNQVRYIELSFEVAGEAIRRSLGPLFPLFFAGMISVLVLATLIYYAERGDKNKDGHRIAVDGTRSKFESIPKTIWFAVTTITTTGYGDMAPLTFWGRMITFATMLTGMLLIALPSIIIGRNFSILWHTLKTRNAVPPKPEWLAKLTGGRKYKKKYQKLGATANEHHPQHHDNHMDPDLDAEDNPNSGSTAEEKTMSRGASFINHGSSNEPSPLRREASDILKTAVSADDLDHILSSAREFHQHQQQLQQKAVTCPRCRHRFQTSAVSARPTTTTMTSTTPTTTAAMPTGPGRSGDFTAPSPLAPSRSFVTSASNLPTGGNSSGGVSHQEGLHGVAHHAPDGALASSPSATSHHTTSTTDSEILRILLLEMAKANLNIQKLIEASNEMDDLSFGNGKKSDNDDDDDDNDDEEDVLGI